MSRGTQLTQIGQQQEFQSLRAETVPPPAPTGGALSVYARACLVTAMFLVPVIISPGAPDSVMLVKLTALWFLGVPALGLFLLERRSGGSLGPLRLPCILAIAYAAILVVATALSDHPTASLVGLHRRYGGLLPQLLYVGFMVTLVGVYRRWPEGLNSLARASAAASALVSAYVLIQAAGLDWNRWTIDGQPPEFPISTMGNSNFAGGYLAITLPLSIFMATRTGRSGARAALWIGCGVQILALWYTHTRGGLLAALGSLLVMAFLIRDRLPRPLRVAAVAFGASLAVGALIILASGRESSPGPQVLVRKNTLFSRVSYWRSGVGMVLDHPLLGTGPDTFHARYGQYESDDQAANEPLVRVDKPHNVPLERATDAGVLGAGTYLALAALCLCSAVRRVRTTTSQQRDLLVAFTGSLVAYLTQAFFSIDVPPLAFLGWATLGAVAVLGHGRADEPAAASSPSPGRNLGVGRVSAIAATSVVTLALLLVGARPLRADIAARDGRLTDAMALQPLEAVYPARAGDIARAKAGVTEAPDELRRQLRAAHDYYVLAVRLQPGNVSYVTNVASLNMLWGEVLDRERLEVADRWWQRALTENPHDPGLRNQYRAVQEIIRRRTETASTTERDSGGAAQREGENQKEKGR